MTKLHLFLLIVLLSGSLLAQTVPVAGPLPESQLKLLEESLNQQLADSSQQIKKHPDEVDGYSRRGDIYFFLGKFKEAVADYDKTVELDKRLDASHWRRGIAFFYAGQYKDAAEQFERYHSFDQVDRENGIWRYLSQHKAYGRDKAREGLLKYQKDDREPFPSVYQLFAGTITPEQILKGIETAEISKGEREKRLFYANLYIGLNYSVEGKDDEAQQHLATATQNKWAIAAGYGPHYMWQVGRLHEQLLRTKNNKPTPP